MVFNYTLGIEEFDKKTMNICHRDAVRAVIFKDNTILMVHNNKGDYKFPGGGANKEENHEQTLKREVKEETGYIVDTVKNIVGVFTERNIDTHKENSIFEMFSSYYICEISDTKTVQQLDDYEAQMDFQPVWISLDDAIKTNEEILMKNNIDINSWVPRETKVLKTLKEHYSN